ncbi:MAG: hypothetical protein RR703_00445 [Bacilli bacterium]
MARKRVRKTRITKGERLLYVGGFTAFMCALMLQIFCGASIGNLKMSVEKLNYEITNQSKTNESLTMKVNELTAFDKVKDVVKDMGLAYNNDNIIVIND